MVERLKKVGVKDFDHENSCFCFDKTCQCGQRTQGRSLRLSGPITLALFRLPARTILYLIAFCLC